MLATAFSHPPWLSLIRSTPAYPFLDDFITTLAEGWLSRTNDPASTQTTEMYLRADTTTLLEVMNATLPPSLRKGHFRPPDQLIALLTADQ